MADPIEIARALRRHEIIFAALATAGVFGPGVLAVLIFSPSMFSAISTGKLVVLALAISLPLFLPLVLVIISVDRAKPLFATFCTAAAIAIVPMNILLLIAASARLSWQLVAWVGVILAYVFAPAYSFLWWRRNVRGRQRDA